MSEDKKKFLFHLHNFGEPEEDDGPPPPPMFTEAELAAARDEAYAKGKQDGFQDSQDSIEKKTALLLENAKQSFLELQAQERAREQRYEHEAVHLALKMFQSIYPAWVETHGPKEVENAVEHVLKGAANQQNIKVEVAPSLLSAVEERFSVMTNALTNVSISFHGQEHLGESDMRMIWDNGGAVRDTNRLAEQILQALQEDLSIPAEHETPAAQEDLADPEETRHNDRIGGDPIDGDVEKENDADDINTETPDE